MRYGAMWLVVVCSALVGCGDGKKGGGEACQSDDDCSSGSCVEGAEGAKACTEDTSGW